MSILVVEDEPLIVSFVERGLRAEGFDVVAVERAEAALDVMVHTPVDLVLLDVMLPGMDGFEALGALRAIDPGVPVIMLTARGDVLDRVRGLDLGATDYVVKPFAFAELVARVRAHLRTARARPVREPALDVGPLHLDLLAREAEFDGELISLSTREFALLAYLMRHAGQVVTRGQILTAVWGGAAEAQSNVVDVYVGYLRRKLDRGDRPSLLETVHGVGYRLARTR